MCIRTVGIFPLFSRLKGSLFSVFLVHTQESCDSNLQARISPASKVKDMNMVKIWDLVAVKPLCSCGRGTCEGDG